METMNHLQYLVQRLQKDRIRDRAALQRSQARIRSLEEDANYKSVMLDVLSEDVDRLEAETECQQREIRWLLDRRVGDDTGRPESVAFMKDEPQ